MKQIKCFIILRDEVTDTSKEENKILIEDSIDASQGHLSEAETENSGTSGTTVNKPV